MIKLTKLLTLAKHREVHQTHKDENHLGKTRNLVKMSSSLVKRNRSLEKRETSLQSLKRKRILVGLLNSALLL